MEGIVIAVVGGLAFTASVLVVSPVIAVLSIWVAVMCFMALAKSEAVDNELLPQEEEA